MPTPTQQQPTKFTQGTMDRVPCPHCGKPNDFRPLADQQLIDTGHEFFCDHCDNSMIVTSTRDVKLIAVMKNPSGRRAPMTQQQQQQARQRQALAGAARPPQTFMQKLLGIGPGQGPKRRG